MNCVGRAEIKTLQPSVLAPPPLIVRTNPGDPPTPHAVRVPHTARGAPAGAPAPPLPCGDLGPWEGWRRQGGSAVRWMRYSV